MKATHSIRLDKFGSVHDKGRQVSSFRELVEEELKYQDFSSIQKDNSEDYEVLKVASSRIVQLVDTMKFDSSTLVHDDIGASNIMWNRGNPILIDWTDSIAGPSLRDFAVLTFKSETNIIQCFEKEYGYIDREKLYLHQLMRFHRLVHFSRFEGVDPVEYKVLMSKLKKLLKREKPFG